MANDPNMLNLPMVPVGASGVTGLEPTSPLMDLIRAYQKNISPEPYAQPLMYDWYNMTPEQRVAAGLDPNFPPYSQESDLLASRPMSIGFPPAVKGGAAILKGTVGKGRAGLGLGRGAVGTPPAGGAPVSKAADIAAAMRRPPLGRMNVSGSLPTGQTPFPSSLPQAPRAGLNLRGSLSPEQAIKMQGSGVGLGNVPRSAALKTPPAPGVKYGAGPRRQASYPIQKPRELARQQFSDLMTSSPQRVPAGMQSPIAPLTEAYSKLSAPTQRLLPVAAGTGLAAGVLSRPDAPTPDTNAELAAAYQRMQNQSSPLMSEEAMSMMPPASTSAPAAATPGVPASIAGDVSPFQDNDMPAPAASIAAQMPGQTAGVPGGYKVRDRDMLADIATADLIAKGQTPSTADVMRRVQELQKEIGITDPRKLQTFAQSGAPIKSVAANISPAGAYAKRFGTAKAKAAPKPMAQPSKPKLKQQTLLSDFRVPGKKSISDAGAATTGLGGPDRSDLIGMMLQATKNQMPSLDSAAPRMPAKLPSLSTESSASDFPPSKGMNAPDFELLPPDYLPKFAKGGEISNKSNPALWAASKSEALNKMGGKHSARAMQLATSIYQKKGGKYKGSKSSKNRLANWGKQNMEKGGEVMGGVPGVDSVPILAQQGEYVIPKPIVDSIKTGMPMPTDSVEMMGEMRKMLSNWNPTTEEGKKYHEEVEMLLAKRSSNFPMTKPDMDMPEMKYGGKVMNMPQMMYGGKVDKMPEMMYGGGVKKMPQMMYGGEVSSAEKTGLDSKDRNQLINMMLRATADQMPNAGSYLSRNPFSESIPATIPMSRNPFVENFPTKKMQKMMYGGAVKKKTKMMGY